MEFFFSVRSLNGSVKLLPWFHMLNYGAWQLRDRIYRRWFPWAESKTEKKKGTTHATGKVGKPQHKLLHLSGSYILISEEYDTALGDWKDVSR